MPVVVDAIDTSLLPVDLSRLQLVGYIEPRPEHAFRLARALANCPPAPPLPEPLPEPPDVPISYLNGLQERVRAASLTFDDQLALIARLETALDRDSEQAAAGVLVFEWPGPDAPVAVGALTWILHAVPICGAAIGLAILRGRAPARLPESVITGTTVPRT